ncbi:MAG: hypothetical protein AAF571_06860, partial [Verrucomicrobiota bacterium]
PAALFFYSFIILGQILFIVISTANESRYWLTYVRKYELACIALVVSLCLLLNPISDIVDVLVLLAGIVFGSVLLKAWDLVSGIQSCKFKSSALGGDHGSS